MQGIFRSVALVIAGPDEIRFGQVALAETGHFQAGAGEIRPGQVRAFKIEVMGGAADEFGFLSFWLSSLGCFWSLDYGRFEIVFRDR